MPTGGEATVEYDYDCGGDVVGRLVQELRWVCSRALKQRARDSARTRRCSKGDTAGALGVPEKQRRVTSTGVATGSPGCTSRSSATCRGIHETPWPSSARCRRGWGGNEGDDDSAETRHDELRPVEAMPEPSL